MGETVEARRELHSRATIVNSVLLALRSSKLASLASVDSLKALLQIEYPDYAGGGTLDLQCVWEILADYPEFDPGAADGPMCAMKSWEKRYGMPVQLPTHLRELPDKDIALRSTTCQVPSAELAKLFETTEARARRASMRISVETNVPLQSRKVTWRDRREVGIIAAVIGVLALAFVAYTVVDNMSDGGWQSVSLSEMSRAVPLSSAKKLGDEVAGTLKDERWLKKPADERRADMRDALQSLSAENIRVFIVLDKKDRVRATATWYDDPPKIAVKLR